MLCVYSLSPSSESSKASQSVHCPFAQLVSACLSGDSRLLQEPNNIFKEKMPKVLNFGAGPAKLPEEVSYFIFNLI